MVKLFSSGAKHRRLAGIQRIYLILVACLLLFAILLKIVGLGSKAPLLQTNDPIVPISRSVLAEAAIAGELVVLGIVLLAPGARAIIAAMLLGMIFLAYKGALLVARPHAPCPCLGNPEAWWPWLARHDSAVSSGMAFFLVVGGAITLWKSYSPAHRKPESTSAALRV
jgi:hypothetical protein